MNQESFTAHWILVDDELPPRTEYFDDYGNNVKSNLSEKVLVSVDALDSRGVTESVYDFLLGKWLIELDYENIKVTHWMRMPQPPSKT